MPVAKIAQLPRGERRHLQARLLATALDRRRQTGPLAGGAASGILHGPAEPKQRHLPRVEETSAGGLVLGKLGLDFENHTSHPAPGMLLLYPGGISETELLFPYGSTMFASKVGQLAGNHFATLTQGQEQLPEIGRLTLWEGAQDITIEEV